MTRHEKVPRLLGSSLTDLDLVTSGRGGSAESNEEAGNVPTRCSFYLFTEFSAGKMASKRSFDLSGPFQPRRDATISLYVLSPRFFRKRARGPPMSEGDVLPGVLGSAPTARSGGFFLSLV